MAIKYRFNELKNLFLPPENSLVFISHLSYITSFFGKLFLKDTNL